MILAAADVAVLPATSDYMNPMKVYEYLAAGVAVVAPNQRAVREVVGEVFPGDVGGGLESIAWFTPGSAPELAGAITRASTFARSEVEVPGSWNTRATSLAQSMKELVSRP